MLLDIVLLLLALIVILASAELFTNGIEWLGQRLNLSEGVVGSVLAAVGTALPETLIPFVAVLFFTGKHGSEVGIGAIAGAPFMLSTLTMALCGYTIWFYSQRGRRKPQIKVEQTVIGRDLRFFIGSYSLAIAASLMADYAVVRWIIAALLIIVYPVYVLKTCKEGGEVGEEPGQLHLDKVMRLGSLKLRLIIVQVLAGLAGIVGGAFLFVDNVQDLAVALHFPPVILSLIIAPVATELPEKINSVLWARSGKDTLALGNVTGALVFQSCFPVAFGVAFTEWKLAPGTIGTAVVAIFCAAMYLTMIDRNKLGSGHLMLGGIAYAVSTALLIASGVTSH